MMGRISLEAFRRDLSTRPENPSSAMTVGHTPSPSRGAFRPGFANRFAQKRGRRECRVLAAPAVSCAKVREKCAHEHTGTVGAFRHSLHNGFTAYAALSPETNSSCLRHRRIDGVRAPGRARNTSADLTPATGARTTRFCRTRFQRRSSAALPIAHGPKPALPSASRNRRCRVHRIPSPTSVTIAIRPSWRAGTRRLYR